MTDVSCDNNWSSFGRGTTVPQEQPESAEEHLKKVCSVNNLLNTINPDTQKWAYHFWTAVLRSLQRSIKDTL